MNFGHRCVLSMCAVAAACAGPWGIASAADQIKAGSITSSPPFISYEADGKTLQGIIVDLAAAMSKHLDHPIVFEQIPFSGLIPALKAQRIDAIFSIMNDTAEREKSLDFIDFFNMSSTLLIRHGNPDHVQGVDDSLCGKTVATIRGSLQIALVEKASQQCVAQGKPAIQNNQYATPAEGRLQVQTGRVAGFFGNTPILAYIARTVDNGQTFATIPQEYAPLPLGIGVAKDNLALRNALQKALDAVIQDGSYRKILQRYGVENALPAKAVINGAGGH